MMRSILLTVFLAVLTSCLVPFSRGAENVLDMIPQGACGAVVFHRLSQTDTKIQKLARELGHEDLRYWGSPWFTMKVWMLGIPQGQGLDEHGSFLMVLFPREDRDAESLAMYFVPVTDYQQFRMGLRAGEDGPFARVMLPGQPDGRMGYRNGYAVIAAAKHREILARILAGEGSGEQFAPFHDFLTDHDVAAVVLGDAARSWSRIAVARIDRGTQSLASQSGSEHSNVEACVETLGAPLLGVMETYRDMMRATQDEIDTVALGAHITDTGDIRVSCRIGYKPAGQTARHIREVKGPEDDFLGNLPAAPYVFAASGMLPHAICRGSTDTALHTSGLIEQSSNLGEEEQLHELEENSQGLLEGLRGLAVMAQLGEPDEPLRTNLVGVARVDDAAVFMQRYEQTLQSIRQRLRDVEIHPQPTIEFQHTHFDKRAGLEVRLQNVQLPGFEAVAGYGQLAGHLRRVGEERLTYIVPADEHTILVAYQSRALAQRSLVAIRNSNTLSGHEQLARTAAMLPQDAEWIVFWSPEGLVDQWNRMLILLHRQFALLTIPRPPSGWLLLEPAPTPPIGLAVKTLPDGLRAELVIPAAALGPIGKMPQLVYRLLHPRGPSSGERRIYIYELEEAPTMLTEELALNKARETLAKEGYPLEKWEVYRPDYPPSRAPDGTPDKVINRFGFRPTVARVHFTDGKQRRAVEVHLEDGQLTCFLFFGM